MTCQHETEKHHLICVTVDFLWLESKLTYWYRWKSICSTAAFISAWLISFEIFYVWFYEPTWNARLFRVFRLCRAPATNINTVSPLETVILPWLMKNKAKEHQSDWSGQTWSTDKNKAASRRGLKTLTLLFKSLWVYDQMSHMMLTLMLA